MNILFCSAGRRVELIKEFKRSMHEGKVVVTDVSITAPSIYAADRYYNVGLISDEGYISSLLEICEKEKIDVITTLIDPEIELLAKHRDRFEDIGVIVLAPYEETANLCFDKAQLIKFLSEKGLKTVRTWTNLQSFNESIAKNEIGFPVFIKPRTGSGSVGARKIEDIQSLEKAIESDNTVIIQEYMGDAIDLDADVYIDTVSHKPVSIFSKKKLETRIGGASKTVSFIDEGLNNFINQILNMLQCCGPIDIDFFYKNGEYYLSEINPRFGGAYIHAYECGIDFFKLIENNVAGLKNAPVFGNYDEGIVMMMYDSLIVRKIGEFELHEGDNGVS